jgi:hypothetical protein
VPSPFDHSAEIISRDRFEKGSMNRKALDKSVIVLNGKIKGKDIIAAHDYRFDSGDFTPDQAREWLKDHKVNPISFEEATGKKKS